MDLKNSSYVIYLETKNFTEKYYKEKEGWVKISAKGNKLKMTSEQVLNHLLPVIAGIKPDLVLRVEHKDDGNKGV